MSDPNIGSAREPAPNSLSGMYSTLVPVLITAGIYLGIFLILRKSHRRYYAPRTYLGSLREQERTPALPSGLFNWFGTFWKIPDTHALQHQSLDAYLFLRFLRIIVTICFVGCCMMWPVLWPINATGGGGQKELDILSYANINNETSAGKNRIYAHAFMAWIYYGFVMYMIMRETIFYINLRQAFLLSPVYSNRISSRTVLFTSVPEAFQDEAKLRKLFGDSVKYVWITSDSTKVDDLVEERDKVAMKLEKAEVKLLKLANANRIKSMKKGGSAQQHEHATDTETGSLAARWLPAKKRPSHRTGPLGLLGKKVDTIEWCRTELQRLIPAVTTAQADYRHGSYKKIPAVFVEFFTQAQAESAFQIIAHHQALQMTPRYIGVTPGEVVWKSLSVPWWQRVVRRFAVLAFITVLIIFWAIPVGVVGIISNVSTLKNISFLTWLNQIPDAIMGVVTGLLPSVALSILMSLVPVIMRLCAKLSGEPSLSRVELFTQHAYFAFQIIQVFLITTLTSAATSVVPLIAENPGSVIDLLSSNLPKASNFYINYFIVQGLTIASSVISQVVGFVIFTLLYKLLAGTPRAMYTKWANLSAISWGSTLPVYTNIAVISLCYAVIAPLVLGWATIGMSLFYLAYRYNILFVTDTKIDTRGLIYPRALKQLFSGIYISEIVLLGLFATSVAIGPIVIMVVLIIFTALFHITMNNALDPLLHNLPRSVEVEEQELRAYHGTLEAGMPANNGAKNGFHHNGTEKASIPSNDAGTAPVKKPNKITKFLKPWIYADYHTLRKLVPHDLVDADNLYTDEVEQNAYYPPSVASRTPLLWIPQDPAGISKQEIAHTSKVIPITDEGCILDEKNKLQWDSEGTRPPIWDEKIYY